MNCPVCHHLLTEGVPACPRCSFHLAQADQYFGAPPILNPELTDLAEVLSNRDEKRICNAISDVKRRFPQLDLSVLIARVPRECSLRVFTFWLFNRGALCEPLSTGGNCHLVLLALDADSGRLACMVGYGLEPFLRDDQLAAIVETGCPDLQEREYTEALLATLDALSGQLAAACQQIPRTFGLHEEDDEETAEEAEAYVF